MKPSTTLTGRELFVNLTVMAGGVALLPLLLLGWPFVLTALLMQPALISGAVVLLWVVGYSAVRRQSRLLAILFFAPCVIPSAWLLFYAIEPIYIPHLWEPSKLIDTIEHPDFDRRFEAAVAGGASWTTNPEEVVRTYADADDRASIVRVWLNRDSDSTASAVALTSYPYGNYGNENVVFRRIQLTRSGEAWRVTSAASAKRRRGSIFWNDQ